MPPKQLHDSRMVFARPAGDFERFTEGRSQRQAVFLLLVPPRSPLPCQLSSPVVRIEQCGFWPQADVPKPRGVSTLGQNADVLACPFCQSGQASAPEDAFGRQFETPGSTNSRVVPESPASRGRRLVVLNQRDLAFLRIIDAHLQYGETLIAFAAASASAIVS